MLFPTIEFAIFFAIVFGPAWFLNSNNTLKKLFLTAASLVFYSFWDWRFVSLLLLSAVGNLIFGLLIGRQSSPPWRKFFLIIGIAANLSPLLYFKYYDFLSVELSNTLASLGWIVDFGSTGMALPIAISFLTFHAISYIVDVYKGTIGPTRSLLDLALYLSFFPHLVAGPIVRAKDFLTQLEKAPSPDAIRLGKNAILILGGLFKKVVIASNLSVMLVDPVFQDPTSYSAMMLLVAIYAYAVVIYCDFSGYTDIAIGIAGLLGYRFPDNFNRPYLALSIGEFWRRWHITLSSWLRDYVYVPLGGSRGGLFATCRNLLLTMFLGGLWHGAGVQFIVWGLLHGVGLAVERVAGGWFSPRPAGRFDATWNVVRWFATFHFVCLGWVFFRSPDIDSALAYLGRLVSGADGLSIVSPTVVILILAGFCAQFMGVDNLASFSRRFDRLPLALKVLLPPAAIWITAVLSPVGMPPFIYFQF